METPALRQLLFVSTFAAITLLLQPVFSALAYAHGSGRYASAATMAAGGHLLYRPAGVTFPAPGPLHALQCNHRLDLHSLLEPKTEVPAYATVETAKRMRMEAYGVDDDRRWFSNARPASAATLAAAAAGSGSTAPTVALHAARGMDDMQRAGTSHAPAQHMGAAPPTWLVSQQQSRSQSGGAAAAGHQPATAGQVLNPFAGAAAQRGGQQQQQHPELPITHAAAHAGSAAAGVGCSSGHAAAAAFGSSTAPQGSAHTTNSSSSRGVGATSAAAGDTDMLDLFGGAMMVALGSQPGGNASSGAAASAGAASQQAREHMHMPLSAAGASTWRHGAGEQPAPSRGVATTQPTALAAAMPALPPSSSAAAPAAVPLPLPHVAAAPTVFAEPGAVGVDPVDGAFDQCAWARDIGVGGETFMSVHTAMPAAGGAGSASSRGASLATATGVRLPPTAAGAAIVSGSGMRAGSWKASAQVTLAGLLASGFGNAAASPAMLQRFQEELRRDGGFSWCVVGNKIAPAETVAAAFAVYTEGEPEPSAAGLSAAPRRPRCMLWVLPLAPDDVVQPATGGTSAAPAADVSSAGVPLADRWTAFAAVLSTRNVRKVAVDAKAHLYALLRCPLTSRTPVRGLWDPLVAAWMMSPDSVSSDTGLLPPAAVDFQPGQTLSSSGGGSAASSSSFAEPLHAAGRGLSLQGIISAYRLQPKVPAGAHPVAVHLIQATMVANALRPMLEARGLLHAFEAQEMRLLPVLAAVECTGMGFAPRALTEASQRVQARLSQLESEAHEMAGCAFMLTSSDQVAKLLYGDLGMVPPKSRDAAANTYTKNQAKTHRHDSVNMAALEALAVTYGHPLPGVILDYRKLFKQHTTFVVPLATHAVRGPAALAAAPFGGGGGSAAAASRPTARSLPCGLGSADSSVSRLFTQLNQTNTGTGRLSSTNPNLQNLPRDGLAHVSGDDAEGGITAESAAELLNVRRAFCASGTACTLLSLDYSQIEMRVLAHVARDDALLAVFGAAQPAGGAGGAYSTGGGMAASSSAGGGMYAGGLFAGLPITTVSTSGSSSAGCLLASGAVDSAGGMSARGAAPNADIYSTMAARAFNLASTAAVTPEQRAQAKSVVLGVVYGIGTEEAARKLGITKQQADDLRGRFMRSYPGIGAFMSRAKAFAHRYGHVVTMTGRRRLLPDIALSGSGGGSSSWRGGGGGGGASSARSAGGGGAAAGGGGGAYRDKMRVSYAERQAVNTIIQGTAADIIKVAMVQADARLRVGASPPGSAPTGSAGAATGPPSLLGRMVLQVHDELLFEVPSHPAALQAVAEAMREVMTVHVPAALEQLSHAAVFARMAPPGARPTPAQAYYADAAALLGGTPRLRVPLAVSVDTGRDWAGMIPLPLPATPPAASVAGGGAVGGAASSAGPGRA